MKWKCEYCDQIADERDWGDSGDMNGNLPICPYCGGWDAVDYSYYDDDEEEDDEQEEESWYA